jgi:hypothetical protein
MSALPIQPFVGQELNQVWTLVAPAQQRRCRRVRGFLTGPPVLLAKLKLQLLASQTALFQSLLAPTSYTAT